MDKVLLAMFDGERAALDARSRLLAAGFTEDAVAMAGAAEDEAGREAFRRGASGVTVRIRSEAELDRAEQVLNAAGAFDLDQRSEQWRREGWAGVAADDSTGAPATGAGFTAFQEGVLEVRERVEEAVVRKTARVVEEVEIRKQITEREEVVRDTLRKTQVEVGRVEPASRESESKP